MKLPLLALPITILVASLINSKRDDTIKTYTNSNELIVISNNHFGFVTNTPELTNFIVEGKQFIVTRVTNVVEECRLVTFTNVYLQITQGDTQKKYLIKQLGLHVSSNTARAWFSIGTNINYYP